MTKRDGQSSSKPVAPHDRTLHPPEMTVIADHAILRELDPVILRESDQFRFDAKMGAAFDIIRHKLTQTPIAVAVYGDWGTGKTSGMRWLQKELRRWSLIDEAQRDSHPTVDAVWFEPWKYHDREDVWRGLIAEVILHCVQPQEGSALQSDLGVRIKEAARQFGRFLGRSFLHALSRTKLKLKGAAAEIELSGEAFQDVYEEYNKFANPEAAYLNDFESTLKQWVTTYFPQEKKDGVPARRLAVFIDDLDRCLPAVTLVVLEALKLYLNIPGLVFVIGLDRAVVDAVVRKHYIDNGLAPEKARFYLNKMFQVEIDIPPSSTEVREFLKQQIVKLNTVTNPSWSQLLESATAKLKPRVGTPGQGLDVKQIIESRIEVLCESNPREVKRTLNSTLLRATAARLHVGRTDEAGLAFAQGAQVYLIGQFIKRSVGLDATWLIRTPEALDFFVAYSKFRRKYPDYPLPDRREREGKIPAESEIPKRAPHERGEGDSDADRAFAALAAACPEDGEGNSCKFETNPHLWQLMAIPFERSIADIAAARIEQTTDVAPAPAQFAAQAPPPAAPPAPAEQPRPTSPLSAADALAAMPKVLRSAVARALDKPVGDLSPSDLQRVEKLQLEGAKITDFAPLAAMGKLEYLDLDRTKIGDAGLEHLKALTTLQRLYLNGTQVTDAGFAHLKPLTTLQFLGLNRTQVTDAGLAHLKGLTALRGLSLNGTQVTDAGLEHLKELTSLQGLYLNGTQVTDDGLAHLKELTTLQRLFLDGTQVTDAGLAHLKALTTLQWLDLDNTQVTNAGVAALRKAIPQCFISHNKGEE